MGRTTWGKEQDQKILDGERRGLSTSLIAEGLGMTIGAVMGRLHRLRGYKRSSANRVTVKAAPKPTPTTVVKKVTFTPRPPPQQPVKPVVVGTLKITELTERTCKWPFGDYPPYLYCGAPPVTNTRHPYCAFHLGMTYR